MNSIVNFGLGKTSAFTGRNGSFQAQALLIDRDVEGIVIIRPITTKGAQANCEITLPVSAVPQLAAALLNDKLALAALLAAERTT